MLLGVVALAAIRIAARLPQGSLVAILLFSISILADAAAVPHYAVGLRRAARLGGAFRGYGGLIASAVEIAASTIGLLVAAALAG